MRNRLLEEYAEEQIVEAAKKYLREKLNWSEPPREVIIDDLSLFLDYYDGIENLAHYGPEEPDISIMFSKGKSQKYAWIQFEHYDGLRKYITSTT